jgi:hypothetical protein
MGFTLNYSTPDRHDRRPGPSASTRSFAFWRGALLGFIAGFVVFDFAGGWINTRAVLGMAQGMVSTMLHRF